VYADWSGEKAHRVPRRRNSRLDDVALARLASQQDGLVRRAQVIELGGDDVDIRSRLRRREWAAVHRGVYVDHTGPLTASQRLWAAVLLHWPAAVHRESALELHGLRQDRRRDGAERPVHLVMDASRRTPAAVPGIVVERMHDAKSWLTQHRRPPRVKVELAVLKVASSRDLAGAIAVISDACQQRHTDVPALLLALDRLGTLRGRAALVDVLRDVESGAHSVLEHRYLRDVERAHGLPAGCRQLREVAGGRVAVRDVVYVEQDVVVELDGRFGHTDALDRWADLDRDLSAARQALLTIRLGWAQVLSPCQVAAAVAEILTNRGWTGSAHPCRRGCQVGGRGQ
jgi:hypothetical protein